jgi:methyltransferase (TIGR00027 family)
LRGGRASRSSQAVAAYRAMLERPSTPGGDAGAQARMTRGMRPAGGEKLREHLVVRTRFFDGQVLAAIAAGITQVVILGAGYDDRPLRFAAPRVRFFELDQASTQAGKRRRLQRIGGDLGSIALVAADFRTDDAARALASAGHDASAASLFVCEGLLVYLDEAANVTLLRQLRDCAAPASRLAASLAIHPDGEDSEQVKASANAIRRNAASEPWLTILPASGQRELVARAGWEILEEGPQLRGMLCVVAGPA